VSRLRYGEWITAASGVALAAVLFLDWFGGAVSGSGWSTLGWLALALCAVAILAALALPFLQVTRDSPSGPVLGAIAAALAGFLASVALVVQGIAQPGPDELVSVRAGYWLGLACALGVWLGGFLAMRDERSPHARPRPVELRPAP
jgi:hypothetical protein